jgi:hypothetical protein
MNKEQILEDLKSLVLMIRDDGEKLRSDKAFRDNLKQKHLELNKYMEELNSCDADWFNTEYGKWHKKEIMPCWDKLDPELIARFE